LRGSGRKELMAVKFFESWGVRKLPSKSGAITLPRREGKIFFVKKNFGRGCVFDKNPIS